MKISELILRLAVEMKEHGDVEVLIEDSPIDRVEFYERSSMYDPVVRLD